MEQTLERLRGEFLEMPGLRLTVAQTERLCGVETLVCKAVLDALVDAIFLCVKADGSYARLTDGAVSGFRIAKADLRSSVPATIAS